MRNDRSGITSPSCKPRWCNVALLPTNFQISGKNGWFALPSWEESRKPRFLRRFKGGDLRGGENAIPDARILSVHSPQKVCPETGSETLRKAIRKTNAKGCSHSVSVILLRDVNFLGLLLCSNKGIFAAGESASMCSSASVMALNRVRYIFLYIVKPLCTQIMDCKQYFIYQTLLQLQ